MKIAYHSFKGLAPRIAPRLLPDGYSQEADSTKLWSGELRPFYDDLILQDVPSDTVAIYQYRHQNGTNIWLSWNRCVEVVKGPVYNDTYNRIILSGLEGGLRTTDSTYITATTTTVDNTNSVTLKVPSPNADIVMTVSGTSTSDNLDSRSYVVSWVRQWGDGKLDVSAPSAPAQTSDSKTVVDVKEGQIVTLTNIMLPANGYTNSGIRVGYVYRSSVGSDGTVAYRWVGQFQVTNGVNVYTFTDAVPTLDLGETLPSLDWDAPLDTLTGIVSLNNGVLAAFDGANTVYMSYPYQSHAWPATYSVTMDHKIMGLGSFGNNIVVCTEANPTLILVQDPAAATVQPIAESFPCLASRGIISTASGVIFITNNGLCFIDSTDPTILTESYITRDELLPLNPKSIIASSYDRSYFGIFTEPTQRYGFIFDLEQSDIGLVHLSKQAQCLWTDPEEEQLYMVRKYSDEKTSIVRFDADKKTRRAFKWRSKIEIAPEGLLTYTAARVRADYLGGTGIQYGYIPPYIYIQNCINDLEINTIEVNGTANMESIYASLRARNTVIFRYIVDGRVRYEKKVTDILPFRLPSGFRGWECELELETNIPVHYIEIATSMGELT